MDCRLERPRDGQLNSEQLDANSMRYPHPSVGFAQTIEAKFVAKCNVCDNVSSVSSIISALAADRIGYNKPTCCITQQLRTGRPTLSWLHRKPIPSEEISRSLARS